MLVRSALITIITVSLVQHILGRIGTIHNTHNNNYYSINYSVLISDSSLNAKMQNITEFSSMKI